MKTPSFESSVQVIMTYVVFLCIVFVSLSSNAVEVQQTHVEKRIIVKAKWGASTGEIGQPFFTGQSDQMPSESLNPIAVDSRGNIYIGDSINSRVQKYDSAGKFIKEVKLPNNKLYMDYVVVSNDNAMYVLISRGHPKIVKFGSSGKLESIYDLSNAGRLEKSRDGKM